MTQNPCPFCGRHGSSSFSYSEWCDAWRQEVNARWNERYRKRGLDQRLRIYIARNERLNRRDEEVLRGYTEAQG